MPVVDHDDSPHFAPKIANSSRATAIFLYCPGFASVWDTVSSLNSLIQRVCDLTRVLAGPYCTVFPNGSRANRSKFWATWGQFRDIVADCSAEVIKVENPKTGDDTRAWGPPFAKALPEYATVDYPGESAYFLSVYPPRDSAYPGQSE